MNKEAAGGRKSFELMGGTQDQEAYAFLKGSIWRTVSFQALPKSVLRMRNYLILAGVLSLAIDGLDSYFYAKEFQWYKVAKTMKYDTLTLASAAGMQMTIKKDFMEFCPTLCYSTLP